MKGIRLRFALMTMILVTTSLGGYIYYFHGEDLANQDNLLVIAAAVLVSGIISFLVTKGASRPVEAIGQSLAAIANGDFTVRAKKIIGNDLGALADAYNNSLDKVRYILKDAKETTDEMLSSAAAIEDIPKQSQEASSNFEGSVKESLKKSSASLEEMRTLVDNISDMLSQMSAGVSKLLQVPQRLPPWR